MAISLQSFRTSLYEEHLEEASFLYDQRRALVAQSQLAWTDLDAFEQRLEAHLDALMVGADLALHVSRLRAVAGDAGELFAAVCVFCRRGEAALLSEVLKQIDVADAERMRAVADALKYELPPAWEEFCLRAVADAKIEIAVMLAQVAAYRRLPARDCLLATAQRTPPSLQPAVMWAMGRNGESVQSSVRSHMAAPATGAVRAAALRAGLRLQDPEAVRRLYELAADGSAPAEESGLAGGRFMAAPLLAQLASSPPDPAAAMALGLLGDLSAVRPLVKALTVADFATHAAQALYVITGAQLFESALVPDEIGEDEMFDKELRTFRETGAMPQRGDGEAFGDRVVRLSTDPARWDRWLSENARRFSGEQRYRCGLPASPKVLLSCLVAGSFPKAYRAAVMEELLIRYGVDLAIEPDMPVRRQWSILQSAANTIAAAEQATQPGRWYAQGQALSR